MGTNTTSNGQGRQNQVLATYTFANGHVMTLSKLVYQGHSFNTRLTTEYRLSPCGGSFKTAKAGKAYAEYLLAQEQEQIAVSNFRNGIR